MVIAIDGPAGAGKSTVARRLAARLGFLYVETGATYRAVALLALRRGIDLREATALERLAAEADIRLESGPEGNRLHIGGEDVTEALRAAEVAQAASLVSTVPGVRRHMVALQRRIAQASSAAGGVILEGRDVGSVVFPEADLKVFLDASPEDRARRRFLEQPEGRTLEQVLAEVRERDLRDSRREHSPLVQAPGAFYLDTTGLSVEQVVDRILERLESQRGKRPEKP